MRAMSPVSVASLSSSPEKNQGSFVHMRWPPPTPLTSISCTLCTLCARRVGHGAGNGVVHGRGHHQRGGVRRGGVGLESRAHDVDAQARDPAVVGDLRRSRDGLVVIEDSDGPCVRCHRFDRLGEARPRVRQLGRDGRRHGPVDDTLRAEADADAEHPPELVFEAVTEVDVVRARLQEHEAGRMLGQVGVGELGAQAARPLARYRALCVTGCVVRRVGHGTADGELIPSQVAVGGAYRHGEVEGMGDEARVGLQRGALGHVAGRQSRARGDVRVGESVAVGH